MTPANSPRARGWRRLIPGVLTFSLLVAVFVSWALVEPRLRSSPSGGRVLSLLEHPLLRFGEHSLSLLFLLKAVGFLLLLGLVAGRVRVLVGAFLLRGPDVEPGQRHAVENIAGYVIFVLGCIIGLQNTGIDLSSLAVLGGALGVGIGLGLQQSANNFLSGIILLLERPVKVGDRVEVGTLDGDVVRIGSRATWVRTNANIIVIVPNSEFVMQQVINWTATDRQVRFNLPVGVSYRSSPDEVREALLSVARANPDVMDDPGPEVLFDGFGESSLDFQLRVWTVTKVRTPNVLRSDLYFAIHREFARRGIEIPYPQRDLHLRTAGAALRIERE